MKMQIGNAAALFAAGWLATQASVALAQTKQQFDTCNNTRGKISAERQVSGCTALIESGKLSKVELGTAYGLRAFAHFLSSDTRRALADFAEAAALGPMPAEAHLFRGDAYIMEKDFAAARASLAEAIRLNPKFAAAYHRRGVSYAAEKDFARAIEEYDQAVKLDPAFAAAFRSRGFAYSDRGEFERAIVDFDRALQIEPKSSGSLNSRCWVRAILGRDLAAARSDCDQSLRLDQNDPDALNSRALVFFKLKQYSEAISDYDKALGIDPKDAGSLFGRGAAKHAAGNVGGGDADILAALAVRADVVDEYVRYGVPRPFSEALNRTYIERCDALSASPSDKSKPRDIPGVAFDRIKPALAIPACEAAMEIAPVQARLVYQLGRAHHAAKAYDKAHQFYAQAQALDHPLAFTNRAVMFADGLGVGSNYDEAAKLYERAALLGDPIAMSNLGGLYDRDGFGRKDGREAMRRYRDAAEADRPFRLVPQLPNTFGGFVVLSRDGRVAATASNWLIKIWDVSSGTVLRTIRSDAATLSLALSSDGRTLIGGGYGKTVQVWDTGSGRLLRTMSGHTDSINSVALASDDETIVSGSNDKTIRIWNATTGQQIRTLTGHTEWVNGVAISHDRRRIASVSDDCKVGIWNIETGQSERFLSGHVCRSESLPYLIGEFNYGVREVAFLPDGNRIVSGGQGDIRIWNVSTGELLRSFQGHESDGEIQRSFRGHEKAIATLVPLSHGKIFSGTGTKEDEPTLWDPDTGEVVVRYVIRVPATDAITKVAFAGWKSRYVSDLRAIGLIPEAEFRDHIWRIATSPGNMIAAGGIDKSVRLWDRQSGRLLRVLSGHNDVIEQLAFSHDGRLLASSSKDRTIMIWDAESGRALHSFKGGGAFANLMFSIDGAALIFEDRERQDARTIRRYDLKTASVVVRKELDVATLERAKDVRPRDVTWAESQLTVWADGVPVVTMTSLPEGHWVAIAGDGLTYTGSLGCEKYLRIVKGFEARAVTPDDVRENFRKDGLATKRQLAGEAAKP